MTGGDDLDSPPLPSSNRSSLESGRSIGGVANSISPSVMIPERIVTDHRRQSEDMRHREVSFVGHFVFLIFIVSFAISSSSTVPSSLFPLFLHFIFSLSLSLSFSLSLLPFLPLLLSLSFPSPQRLMMMIGISAGLTIVTSPRPPSTPPTWEEEASPVEQQTRTR